MATRMTDVERAAGQRADFHVYYRRNGKLRLDAIWAPSVADAQRQMSDFARELRWRIEIVRIDPVAVDA